MAVVEDGARGGDVRGAEIDGEVQRHGGVAADGPRGGDVDWGVDAKVCGRVVGGREGVVFEVGSIRGLLISLNGFHEGDAERFVETCRAGCIIRAVQCRLIDAVPCDVGIGSDHGEHLLIAIRDRVQELVVARRIAVDTTIWQSPCAVENREGFGTGLGQGRAGEEGEKQGAASCIYKQLNPSLNRDDFPALVILARP